MSNKGIKLSKDAKRRISKAHWKGGRIENVQGYIWIYSPTHPYTNHKGYVYMNIV